MYSKFFGIVCTTKASEFVKIHMLKLTKRKTKISLRNTYINSRNDEKRVANEKKYDENDIKIYKIVKKY